MMHSHRIGTIFEGTFCTGYPRMSSSYKYKKKKKKKKWKSEFCCSVKKKTTDRWMGELRNVPSGQAL
jgi:hypothetical protein